MIFKEINTMLENSADIVGIVSDGGIFSIEVPEEYSKAGNDCFICFNELPEEPDQHASNKLFNKFLNVQIDAWADDLSKLDQLEKILDQLFFNNSWAYDYGTITNDETLGKYRLIRRYARSEIIFN